MNPIIPFFCQYMWQKYVFPSLENSQNVPATHVARLSLNGWVKFEDESNDPVISASISYLEKTKKSIRQAFEKAQSGGSKKKGKKGKGAAEPEEAKTLSNVIVFVGTEFPEF